MMIDWIILLKTELKQKSKLHSSRNYTYYIFIPIIFVHIYLYI